MGNDGGSIPTRRELVKEAARNPTTQQLKETRTEQQDHLWNVDPLSQKPLGRPVVSDALGRLFNKDSVIEFLLPSEDDDATKKAEQADLLQGAIKSLKDVVEIKFEVEEFGEEDIRVGGIRRSEKWVCPVTRQELGPGAKAVYLVPCGHAFSGVAVKEISGEHCLQCNESYASNDIIPIFPTVDTDIARLSLRAKTLKDNGLTHALKKAAGASKKRKKTTEMIDVDVQRTGSDDVKSAAVSATSDVKHDRPSTPATKPSSTAIKNASTASLTQKILQEQEERNKKRKMDRNDNLNSLFSKSKDSAGAKSSDISFMNRGFSIPSER